ncbi:MAG: methyltransferase [Candidatus Thorarchaeota archaeon]|nr:methyltransferase [Candidatus Thorarchaeota archaeon]
MLRSDDLEIVTFPNVYPPSEDSYLLCDSIEATPGDTLLDVGCGTGLIALSATKVARYVLALDISLEAVRNTSSNARANRIDSCFGVVQSDLLGALRSSQRFSIIAFNPPYLPADGLTSSLDCALIGGETGTEVTIRLINQAVGHLTDGGCLYVVVSSLARPDAIMDYMRKQSLAPEVVAEANLFFEHLQVLRGRRLSQAALGAERGLVNA